MKKFLLLALTMCAVSNYQVVAIGTNALVVQRHAAVPLQAGPAQEQHMLHLMHNMVHNIVVDGLRIARNTNAMACLISLTGAGCIGFMGSRMVCEGLKSGLKVKDLGLALSFPALVFSLGVVSSGIYGYRALQLHQRIRRG